MKARFYDPLVGRFLQPDSIVPDYANPQSLNRYSYVLNNPLRYTDPTGHCSALGDTSENCIGWMVNFDVSWAVGQIGQQDAIPDEEICFVCAWTHHETTAETDQRHDLTWDTYFAVQILESHGYNRHDYPWSLDQIRYLQGTEFGIDPYKLGPKEDWWTLNFGAAAGLLAFGAVSAQDGSEVTPPGGPGPFARKSIAARGSGRSFTSRERDEIDRIGSETGCHTCGSKVPGTRSGRFIRRGPVWAIAGPFFDPPRHCRGHNFLYSHRHAG
jgi:hypothetical protein